MKKKILILGLGVSGKASAAFLLMQGYSVTGADRKAEELRNDPRIASLLTQGMKLTSDEEIEEPFDQLILSPGIPLTHPLVQKIKARGGEVIGEIEMALRHVKNRVVAVTGSNGKTTTVMLIEHLLKCAGNKARALGNIGASLSEYLLYSDPEEILVLELSSFQLETASTRLFEAAAILNITPNHLNWHPDMESYAKAKARIGLCLKDGGTLFVSKQVASEFGYLLKSYEIFDQETVAPNSNLSYIKRGLPEKQNVQAAFAFCAHFGLDLDQCTRNLETFRKPPHRIEWIAEIDNVSYFNDSKASNIHAVMHAVNLFESPLILIAGGVHKGAPYLPWVDSFQGKVKWIMAFGEASSQMESELSPHIPFIRVKNLEEAVFAAKRHSSGINAVILSPGCSSYDQFRSYEHRGEEFKRIVREELK